MTQDPQGLITVNNTEDILLFAIGEDNELYIKSRSLSIKISPEGVCGMLEFLHRMGYKGVEIPEVWLSSADDVPSLSEPLVKL